MEAPLDRRLCCAKLAIFLSHHHQIKVFGDAAVARLAEDGVVCVSAAAGLCFERTEAILHDSGYFGRLAPASNKQILPPIRNEDVSE